MALPDEDRRALAARLAPAGAAAAEVVAEAVDEDEELREIVVDAQGDVVAFTDRRALFVADGAGDAVAITYGDVEVRQRDAGLAIDALIEGGRLVLAVARGTFARLAVVGTGAAPGRATWLPIRTPPRRDQPPPALVLSQPASQPPPPQPSQAVPPPPPGGANYLGERASAARAPVPVPPAPPSGHPPAGWHPDPAGRHWWRWWDGIDWTDHVADGGSPFVDPLPPRP